MLYNDWGSDPALRAQRFLCVRLQPSPPAAAAATASAEATCETIGTSAPATYAKAFVTV